MRLDMFSICTIAIVRSFKRKYDSSFLSLKSRNLSILIEILLITYIDVGQLSILFTPDNSFFGDEKMIFKSKESFPIHNKLSDVNKAYIDIIGNGQKFELTVTLDI